MVLVRCSPGERLRPCLGDHRRRPLACPPGAEDHSGGDGEGGELEPVLDGLDQGDRAHPAGRDREDDDDHHDEAAHPPRRAGHQPQREAGALELRDQVEPADEDDEHRAQVAQRPRAEPPLGEVGQRVGARAAQRRGHQDQQDEVADGVADRVPQRVHALVVDEPGDAEEGGGREVLAADRRGVAAGRDGAAGDVEVAGPAGEAQREQAQAERDHADDGDGGRRQRRRHRSSFSASVTKAANRRSVCSVRRAKKAAIATIAG